MTAQQPINYKALSWTGGVHILLFLLFFLWKYGAPTPVQPIPEMGMEVNLGSSDNGFGTDQPLNMEDPAPAVAINNSNASAAQANSERDVETSEDPDAPEAAPVRPVPNTRVQPTQPVTQPRTNRVVATQQPTRTSQPQPQRVRVPLYAGGAGRGGNGAQSNAPGGNEGVTAGNGDQGVRGGTPGASNYAGSPGTGTGGIGFDLDGRNMIAFPPKEAEFRQGGKVVLRVTVNRDGVIIGRSVKSSTNAELTPIAIRKLQAVKFNRSESAPAEQFGIITFVFKTRS